VLGKNSLESVVGNMLGIAVGDDDNFASGAALGKISLESTVGSILGFCVDGDDNLLGSVVR
jgi:hypothetical protein